MKTVDDITAHCIGDSHVSVFTGKDIVSSGHPCPQDSLPPFRTYRIGGYLAYSFGNPAHEVVSKVMSIVQGLPKEDRIMLSFGEIDCRVHLVKQAKAQGRIIGDVAGEAADRYAGFAGNLMDSGRDVMLFAPPPTCNHDDPEARVSEENPYPHLGTTRERNEATEAFTARLRHHFPKGVVLSVFRELVNLDMTSKGEYLRDGVHLSQKAMPLILEAYERLERERAQAASDYLYSLHPY